MDKGLLAKFQSVVNYFNKKNFSSHDFLKKFIDMYEDDYRDIFTKNTLQSTNAQIARMLSENAEALGISKSKRILSENFHGKRSVVQEWKILMVWLTTFTCVSVSASAQTFSSIPNPEENNQTMNQMRSMIRDKDYLPQNLMVNGNISVIDTLKTKKMYEELREKVRTDLNNGNEQLSRLTKLLSSTEKKIKDEADLSLVNDAFSWVKSSHPDLLKRKRNNVISSLIQRSVVISSLIIGNGVNQTKDITPQIEKSIQNKKLTNHIKEILRVYQTYLTDSVIKLNNNLSKLSSDKWEQVVKPLPMKTINTNIFNPYYRGFNYYDSDLLDLVETEQQRTWGFIYSSNYEKKEDSYPIKLEYLSFYGYPQYKVTYDEYSYKVIPRSVYDTNGNLVYVASLTRKNDVPFEEMRRLVYLRDYQNNKYGIKSKSKKTQNYLQLLLCRDNGLEKTRAEALSHVFVAAMASDLPYMADKRKKIAYETLKKVNVYNDSDGKKYMEQLEKDHDSEFGSVYMIERLSNVSFRIVYLDTQLKPSHCAIITYMTGDKPFTRNLSGRLVSIPNNLPPLIDCSGEVYKNVKNTQN